MGITGAPFGRTELLVPPPDPQARALVRGQGPRGPGGWGFGKKCKHASFVVMCLFDKFKKKKKKIEI